MKKLIIAVIASTMLMGCDPAIANHIVGVNKMVNTEMTSMGETSDGKRIKVKYETDYSGNVCGYCAAYVWTTSGWYRVTIYSDRSGYYVYYLGNNYYF